MERKGKWTRGPMTYNGNEVVRVDDPNGGVAGAWRDEDALFVMSAFNAATACEDMVYDGEACVNALPELVEGLEWMMEHSTSKTVRSISANLLNKCRG
jgi:hypothetical protein